MVAHLSLGFKISPSPAFLACSAPMLAVGFCAPSVCALTGACEHLGWSWCLFCSHFGGAEDSGAELCWQVSLQELFL